MNTRNRKTRTEFLKYGISCIANQVIERGLVLLRLGRRLEAPHGSEEGTSRSEGGEQAENGATEASGAMLAPKLDGED